MSSLVSSMARGACPALDAPMQTGDGLLSRIALMDWLTPSQFLSICEASQTHGNGILDISARGNLQVRGLSETSAKRLEADIRGLDLPLREGLAVEWSPLAGLDPTALTDPRPLGHKIIERASQLRGKLAPKFSIVIETGGLISYRELLADIRLTARRDEQGIRWHMQVGDKTVGLVDHEHAADAVMRVLAHLAEQGPRTRGRDMEPAYLPFSLLPCSDSSEDGADHPVQLGLLPLVNGLHGLSVALPFGQANSQRLADWITAYAPDIEGIRPAPQHRLLIAASENLCETLAAQARHFGLLTDAHDPLTEIHACPGQPACRSAHMRTHDLGYRATERAPSLFDGSIRLHLSGCAKACAHPRAAPLTLFGTEEGSHLVFCGKTTDTPIKQLIPDTEEAALVTLSALVIAQKRPDETNYDCLRRLGPERIAAALG